MIAVPFIQPTIITHQTETELVLTSPSFVTECFFIRLSTALALFSGFSGYQQIWQQPHLETRAMLLQAFGSLFGFAMAIVIVTQIKTGQTITLDKTVNQLIWRGWQWLGLKPYEFEYPLDSITEVRIWPETYKSGIRYVIGLMVGETVGCRLPASAMVTNYSPDQAEQIAQQLSQFLTLTE